MAGVTLVKDCNNLAELNAMKFIWIYCLKHCWVQVNWVPDCAHAKCRSGLLAAIIAVEATVPTGLGTVGKNTEERVIVYLSPLVSRISSIWHSSCDISGACA